jgi:alpha-galactosidase
VVYGVRPGRPFLYRIPCTGQRPIRFSAGGLPASLSLNAGTGVITGKAPTQTGKYAVRFGATNSVGRSSRQFTIIVGDTIALTPPMGWNDWYTHYERVTDRLIRGAADAMIASGMADFGYQYVNIDDCWMVKPSSKEPEIGGEPRGPSGAIRPNRRFPDMRALTDYIHAKGLKAGIYSSPGPLTCAQFTGSYQHEQADARTFAKWGFDFLKYDWCSYTKVAGGETLEARKQPYQLMGSVLKELNRDVVFNLCQYGMSDVWKWGAEAGGHCWRTTGDLGLEKTARLPGFYSIGFKNAEHYAYAGPGHWNDPDYILIGRVGNAFHIDAPPAPTALTADEQYSYMSMWALMAAPLIFSGDMDHLDDFTLNVLCNSEVIEVDQDALGKQGRIIRRTDDEFVLAKPMADADWGMRDHKHQNPFLSTRHRRQFPSVKVIGQRRRSGCSIPDQRLTEERINHVDGCDAKGGAGPRSELCLPDLLDPLTSPLHGLPVQVHEVAVDDDSLDPAFAKPPQTCLALMLHFRDWQSCPPRSPILVIICRVKAQQFAGLRSQPFQLG